MKRRDIIPLMLLTALCLTSCNNKTTENETSAFVIKGDTVFVKNSELVDSQIKVSEVKILPYSKEVTTAGTVQPIPTQIAYVAPPFSGRIVRSFIKIGQTVKANSPLFEINSPDFTTTQKDFYQAKSSKELALKELKRKEDLIANGVASQKELDEAANILQIAEKEYENAYAALLVYQVNPNNMVLGQSLTIHSPIDGSVIENNIVTGQYIKEESEPIAVVADLSQVWVTAQVKEKDIRFIHLGDSIEISIPAYPDDAINGKVFHIEESVDENTRSIKVLAICDNKDRSLKLGMYTTVHFLDQVSDCIQVPEKALLQDDKNTYVYVQISPDCYVRTPVDVETTKDGYAIINKGLNANSKIISEGGYYLK